MPQLTEGGPGNNSTTAIFPEDKVQQPPEEEVEDTNSSNVTDSGYHSSTSFHLPNIQKPSKRTEGTNLFKKMYNNWEICNKQFKNITVASWFRKKNADTALFLLHIFPTQYKEATLRLRLQKTPLPNPAHSPYAHLFQDKNYATLL